jgi:hypothetical protein
MSGRGSLALDGCPGERDQVLGLLARTLAVQPMEPASLDPPIPAHLGFRLLGLVLQLPFGQSSIVSAEPLRFLSRERTRRSLLLP